MLSQKLQNSITLLLIWNHFTCSKLNNAYNTKFSHLLTSHFSTTNLPPFLIFSPYNQLVLPAPLQLSLSNTLPIPLGSKFLTDLSTFKHLLFGMLYHTIFVLTLILLKPIFCSHYRLLYYTSSWKLTFFFIPILLSLSLYWTDPLELWSGLLMSFIIHFTSFILDPFICSTRYDLMVFIVCRNKLTWIHWIHVSFMMHFKSSSYHHIFSFHIFTPRLIFCLSHACCCFNEEKIKLN